MAANSASTAVDLPPSFSRRQLRELILQRGNHPGIFTWGLWNELGLNAERSTLMSQLREDAHALDPSRPTTSAADGRAQETFPKTIPVTDIIALKKYPGWYDGPPEKMNLLFDKFQKFAPQPIGVS